MLKLKNSKKLIQECRLISCTQMLSKILMHMTKKMLIPSTYSFTDFINWSSI